jgi:hypothetical protein
VAGIVLCLVLWFNDLVLFRVPAGTTGMCGESRFVYAYPAGAPDPRGNPTLLPSGRSWDFADPNAGQWHVVEYTYRQLDVAVHQDLGLPDFLGEDVRTEQTNHTAWIVEAGEPIRDPTLHEDYNFVVLLDTTKLVAAEDNTLVPDPRPSVPLNLTAPGPHAPQAPDNLDADSGKYATLALGDEPPRWS